MNTQRQVSAALIVAGLCCACGQNPERTDADLAGDLPATDGNNNVAKNDVCGFYQPVKIGPTAADGLAEVPASHPNILYFGRIDCSDKQAPSFAFPGISIRMRFEGDALDMRLRDFGDDVTFNYYNVIIDAGAPFVLEVSPDEERYELARNLSDGVHTVEIFKRVESCPGDRPDKGKAAFLGFRIRAGKQVLPIMPKPRRIEFIGDSITCGYGNEVSTMHPESFPFTPENENAYTAWSAIAARMLGAEYMAIAYSGRGICRNWAGSEGETLPQLYLKIFPDEPDSPLWDISRFVPQVTVINLGTNDYSEGAENIDIVKKSFRIEYADFLNTLRGFYPDTALILTVGPMLSDDYPEGYGALSDITAALTDIVEARRNAGDEKVYLLILTPYTAPWGEDWHPSAAVHQQMAEELVQFIAEHEIL